MSYLSEIEKRHAERRSIIHDSRKIKAPVLTDSESVKEHLKLIKDCQSKLIDKCFLVDLDVQVLIAALRNGTKDPEKAATDAWNSVGLTDEEFEVYARRQHEDAQAREKEAKANGEVPGQQKLFKDDGSVAEAASEVTVKKLEEDVPLG